MRIKSLQEVANNLAKLCVVALGAIYGPHEEPTLDDERIRVALNTLLTPYLCGRLNEPDQHEVSHCYDETL